MQRGVNALADTVKVTLGPKGRNVIIDKKYGSPLVTNDGISIAKEIIPKDRYENMGARLVREVASKTNEQGGDGTTTATVLAQAIINEGIKMIATGANPILLREGIVKAVDIAIEEIKENARAIETREDIERVATISAGSSEIGSLIADAIDVIGHDGVIDIDSHALGRTELEIVEGLRFDKGYLSPYMMTDQEKMIAELTDTYVLITDKKIDSLNEILPILEEVMNVKGKLLIIAEDIEGEALATIVLNKLKGAFNCVAVKTPGFGGNNADTLRDIALITGATVVSRELGYELETATLDMLGMATKVTVSEHTTTIVGGMGDREEIDSSIRVIRELVRTAESVREEEVLRTRLSMLSGVAVIKVGAPTETELKEKLLRVEDAVNATRSAIEEGIVAGGGTSLVLAHKKVAKLKDKNTDINAGITIIRNALVTPLAQIANNAGYKGDVVVEKVKYLKRGYGFDAYEGNYKDMLQHGIVDPVKVVKATLINASSVASTFLTTEAAIVIVEDDVVIPAQQDMY